MAERIASITAPATVATLLARSDTGVIRLHLGGNATETARRLGEGHCFQVWPLFALPSAPDATAENFADVVAELGGVHLGNGWFSGVAIDSLAAALVRSSRCLPVRAVPAGPVREAMPAEPARETMPAEPVRKALPAGAGTALQLKSEEVDDALGSSAACQSNENGQPTDLESEDGRDDSAEELWQYVQGCTAPGAGKALDIRLALEQQLGKQEARRLLSHARATVAKDYSGHKNRILRVGGTAIRLR